MKAILFIVCLSAFQFAYSNVYYVSTSGSNNNNGSSLSKAFATIQKAHNVSKPGDVIYVADGTYNESVIITRSGNSNNYITYQAINKGGAKITNTFDHCINISDVGWSKIQNVGYIVIDGFELVAPSSYGTGVVSDWGAHHITISNCSVHDCGATGIQLNHGDYLQVLSNICYHNSVLFGDLCGSGISIYGKKRFDTNPGNHIVISGNICYNNVNGPTSPKTDGNGIILDDLRCTQSYHSGFGTPIDKDYSDFAVLVENNLCYNNEGAGIQAFCTNNVTIRNNTIYNNQLRRSTDTWRGNLSISCCKDIYCVNNITVVSSSLLADGGSTNWPAFSNNSAIGVFALTGNNYGANYKFYNNITYDLNKISSNSIKSEGIVVSIFGVNANKCAKNPLLVNPIIDGDFSLQSTSPAVDMGTSEFGVDSVDISGANRVQGASVDVGAFELDITPDDLKVEAENLCLQDGLTVWATAIGDFSAGDYAKYCGIDLSHGYAYLKMSLATTQSGSLDIRKGSYTGTIIGTLDYVPTASLDAYELQTCLLTGASDTQDIYLTIRNGSSPNIDFFIFSNDSTENTTSINQIKSAQTSGCSLSIFPDPVVHGNLSLKMKGFESAKKVVISICDLRGATIFRKSFDYQPCISEIDLTNLNSGIYLVKANSGEFTSVQKFIVQ